MTRLLTNHIATMTEMREPQKVLDRANGKPVAVMKNSKLVGYFVPAENIPSPDDFIEATLEDVMALMEQRCEIDQPVLDYLKDK